MREMILFNNGWHFHKGDIHMDYPTHKGAAYTQAKTERFGMGPASIYYDSTPDPYNKNSQFISEKWEHVKLPHDYIIDQKPCKDENNALGYFKYENAWYRKIFSLEPSDNKKRLSLVFEGVATNATIYLNGCLLKHNFCGYNSFEVDITDFVRFDRDNVLAVYVDTSNHEGWWYEGGGIYRDVYLKKTEKISVDQYGVYVIPQKISDSEWRVDFESTLVSIEDTCEGVTVQSDIIDADEKIIATSSSEITIPPHTKAMVKYTTNVETPILWDVDNPYQYIVKTTVLKSGEPIDIYYTKTGFRYFECNPEKGFVLNGRAVKIKGVCGHEDCGLLGKAVPGNVHKYKMKLLKEMGVNGYRTSHYQQNTAILDAADELGFIVFNEARWFSSSEESIAQLETLVKRDRNRPSVFFWSLSNEEPYHLTECGRKITKTLMAAVQRLDNSRVITSAVSNDPDKAMVFDELDVIGINYNLNVFDEIHRKYPQKSIVSSENCATGTTRGWYFEDCRKKGYMSAYDNDTNNWFLARERTWKFIAERDYIMGGYQWDGFEHRGETEWPRLCSQSGAIDLFLQKKDAFYQNQSHWSNKPMIHMLPHWNVDVFDDEPVKVWAYTNCDEAELILNGKSLGRQKVEKYTHIEWTVPYEKGKVEVVGYINGTEVAREIHETAGTPKKLVLRLENEVNSAEDVAIITCYTIDEQGRFVPNASPFVEFHTNSFGQIISTGSDISDHTPLHEPSRKMREGYISVAAGVATINGAPVSQKGTIQVYARAQGLEPARLKIEVR